MTHLEGKKWNECNNKNRIISKVLLIAEVFIISKDNYKK